MKQKSEPFTLCDITQDIYLLPQPKLNLDSQAKALREHAQYVVHSRDDFLHQLKSCALLYGDNAITTSEYLTRAHEAIANFCLSATIDEQMYDYVSRTITSIDSMLFICAQTSLFWKQDAEHFDDEFLKKEMSQNATLAVKWYDALCDQLRPYILDAPT